MKRKLVKQGASTMMVSLPSKWIKANNLDKGDEIDLEEKKNSLIINPEAKKKKSETEIQLTGLTESSIRTIITNAYRIGYDKIKVNFADESALPIIQKTLDKNLIGFEIIKRNEKGCEIENITEPSYEQFDNIFSKIFLNIEELFQIASSNLNGEEHEFEDIERKIQQFDNFCRRVIAKSEIYDRMQLKWAFHTELIHAQRELYHLLRYLEKNKVKADKEAFSLLEDSKNIFQMLEKAYQEKNISLLEKIHEEEKGLIYKKGYSSIKKSNPIVIHHLMNVIRNLYLATSPLSGSLI